MPVVFTLPDGSDPNSSVFANNPDWQYVNGQWQRSPAAPDNRATIGKDNAKYDYVYYAQNPTGAFATGVRLTYNGVPVVYVPQEYVQKGIFANDSQSYSNAYLNKDTWNYLKPAAIDTSLWSGASNASRYLSPYKFPSYGYIIEENKFKELQADKPVSIKSWGMQRDDDWVTSVPIQGITQDANGNLQYFGFRGGASAGEYTTYGGASGTGNLKTWKTGSSGFFPRVGQGVADIINDIGPIGQMIASTVIGPPAVAFFAAYNATTAAIHGNLGQAALAMLPMVVPSPTGGPPILDVPVIAEATKSLAAALNVTTQTAGNIMQSAVNLAASGGDFEQMLRNGVAQYLGNQAGSFVQDFVNKYQLGGLGEVAKSVSTAGTKAMLLNQDVGKATKDAFIKTAVPMAMETTPGWSDFAKSNPNLAADLKSAAVTAAQTGEFKSVVQDYSGRVITRLAQDAAEKELNAEGKSLTDAQKRLISTTVTSAIQGKPIDSALQRYAIDEAKRTVNDGIAVSQGWESDAQKTSAQKLYGNTIEPQDYIAKQQGWEDLAEKNAALKAYGDTITPAGFKEREQVKSIDPTFDAAAYSKLNEVTGDPYQHFLTQGKQANLPTNYEKGAEAALRSIGYKPDGDDIKNVADLFKQSANPDVALDQYYDQHWVTPEEAAAAAKDAGFSLTPEQLSRYTGQTKTGQQAVLEDVSTAARIGKTAQDTRNAFIDKQLEPVIQAYKKEGYSDAEIQAALPGLRDQLNAAVGNKVTALSDYASQVKAVYGDKSPEYAEAQRRLLDAQSALGGYGIVKEGDQYKNVSGEAIKYDAPTSSSSWISSQQQSMSGVYDSYGREYTVGDYLRLPSGANVYDQSGKQIKIGDGMAIEIAGTPASEIGTLAQIGKSPTDKLLPGPLEAMFGGQTGGGAKTGGGFSLLGKTGDGDAVYGKEGLDFTLINYADGTTKAVNPKTQEVYLVPPQKAQELIPEKQDVTPNVVPKPPEPKQTQVEELIQKATEQAQQQRVSEEEVAAMLKGMGYTPTPEEIATLAGIKTPEQAQKEANEYVDPRLVTPDEVRRMYHDLGLVDPTEEDVQRFSGQRAQPEVLGLIKPYLPTASANVITRKAEEDKIAMGQQQQQIGDINERINQLQRQGMSQAEATTKALAELSAGQAGLGQQIGQQQQQTQQQFGDINNRINQLQQQGLSQTEATNQALRELASGQSQLGQQIGQQQQQTQQQFGDVNTRIAQLQQQGLSLSEATNRALQELTAGQAGLGQRIGELATGQAGLGQRIGDVQTGLQNQLGGLASGLTQALTGLGTQIGKTNQGLQQQIGQAQQQANFANLLTLLGVAKQQEKEPPPIPITGEIKPYDFSTDLLQGLYPQKRQTPFSTNDQLLNLTRGIR